MKYTFEQVESYLNQERILKLRDVPSLKGETLTQKLTSFFQENNNCPTIYTSSNILQCGSHKRRSVGDIYNILRFYVPNVRLQDIYNSLIELLKSQYIETLVCNDIYKRVYRKEIYHSARFYDFPIDEYGYELPKELWNGTHFCCAERNITKEGVEQEFSKLNLQIDENAN